MLPNPNSPTQRVHVPVGDKVDVVFENPNIKFSDLLISGKPVLTHVKGSRTPQLRYHLTIKLKKM